MPAMKRGIINQTIKETDFHDVHLRKTQLFNNAFDKTTHKLVRSLSMIDSTEKSNQKQSRKTYSCIDEMERIKRFSAYGNLTPKAVEEAQALEGHRKTRRRSHRRFYEPSVERFPPPRITKSQFKISQEMPFWKLDTKKFRKLILPENLKEEVALEQNKQELMVMPFSQCSLKNLKGIFNVPDAQKLDRKQKKCAKKAIIKKRKLQMEITLNSKTEALKTPLSNAFHKPKEESKLKSHQSMQFIDGGLEVSNCSTVTVPPSKIPQESECLKNPSENVQIVMNDHKNTHTNRVSTNITLSEIISTSTNSETFCPPDIIITVENGSSLETESKVIVQECDKVKKKKLKVDCAGEKESISGESMDSSGVPITNPPAWCPSFKARVPAASIAARVQNLNRQTRAISACRSCDRNAYKAESIEALGNVFHNSCFRCATCTSLLQRGSWNHSNNKFYCNPCHRRISLQTFRH